MAFDLNKYPVTVAVAGDVPSLNRWISKSVYQKIATTKVCTWQEVELSQTERNTQFVYHLLSAHREFTTSSLKNRIKPWGYILPLQNYLYISLSNLFELITINHDDYDEIRQKWRTFQIEFATLRYEASPELSGKICSFLQWVIEDLSHVDGNETEIQDEIELLKACSELIRIEPHLLDVSIGVIGNKEQFLKEDPLIKVGISSALNVNKTLLHLFKKDFFWVLKFISTEIEEEYAHDQYPYPLPLKEIRIASLKALKTLKTKSEQTLNALNLSDCAAIKDQLPLLLEFSMLIRKLIDTQGVGDKSLHICTIEALIKQIEDKVPENRRTSEEVYDIDALIKESGHLTSDLAFGKWTLPQMHDWLNRMKKQQKCHMILDTFVGTPLNSLLKLSHAIQMWTAVHQSLGHLSAIKEELKKQTPTPFLGRYDIDIEKRLKWLGEDKEHPTVKVQMNPKRRKKNRGDKAEKAQASTLENTASEEAASQEVHPILPLTPDHSAVLEVPYPNLQQLSHKLVGLMLKATDPALKIYLRQARMHLDDLSLSKKRLDHSMPQEMRLFAGITAIRTHFFFVEQLLQHKAFQIEPSQDASSLRTHNLNALINLSDVEKKHPTFRIIKQLYLANHWTAYPHQELMSWSQYPSSPKVLTSIQTLLVDPSSREAYLVLNDLKNLTQGAMELSQVVLPSEETDDTPSAQNTILSEPFQMSLGTLKKALKTCHTLLIDLKFGPDHPKNIALSQASYHLYLVAQSCTQFEKDKIDSHSLSFYLRTGIFSLNRAIEELLLASYVVKYGFEYSEVTEHDLWKLNNLVNDRQDPAHVNLLETTFKKAQMISRYPFKYPETLSPLHELILQAELLKEHPELNQGFELKTDRTSLNFIPVPTDCLTADAILKKWQAVLSETLSYVNGTLLPYLK